MSTLHPGGSLTGEPDEDENPSDSMGTSPPGRLPARRRKTESQRFQRGRAYIRPADFGHSKASLQLGPIVFKAGGTGAAAALAVGIVGSVAMTAVTSYCGLPLMAVVAMGATPMVLAMILILIGVLGS